MSSEAVFGEGGFRGKLEVGHVLRENFPAGEGGLDVGVVVGLEAVALAVVAERDVADGAAPLGPLLLVQGFLAAEGAAPRGGPHGLVRPRVREPSRQVHFPPRPRRFDQTVANVKQTYFACNQTEQLVHAILVRTESFRKEPTDIKLKLIKRDLKLYSCIRLKVKYKL